jgi:hypothetical protein
VAAGQQFGEGVLNMGSNCVNYFFKETCKIARYAVPFLKNIDRMINSWTEV